MAVTQIKAVPAFRKTAETFTSGAKTLEQKYFVSQEIFGEEQEKIFSTQWILVGHQSAIAQAGEYFISEVVGASLIVVREIRGEIQGFETVCQVRGVRLVEKLNGQLACLECTYD